MKEVHLFILWENARYKEKEILEDIRNSFNIIGLYNITWNKEKVPENFSRFYGTFLPKDSGKEQHCGSGDFLLVIVEVENSIYEERETSHGIDLVNINMFDKKSYYRELTGGGHKVHATNSVIETNHDLTLLLGVNVEDYLKTLDRGKEVEVVNLKQDLFGSEGFTSVKEMFYALNNCINYAIMRNYEVLPDDIYVNEHNDIDIMCDSLENAAYILNAKSNYPDQPDRVCYSVNVEGKIANFDFRHLGDDYYYYKIEKEILKNRKYNEKGFYTVSDEDYFYTLAYHAIIHKAVFADDYKIRLQKMNPTSKMLETKGDFIKMLNAWLLDKGYMITQPEDHTVLINQENAEKFDKLLFSKETKKIEQLINERTQIENINKELATKLEGIEASRAWKITKPLRMMRKKLK